MARPLWVRLSLFFVAPAIRPRFFVVLRSLTHPSALFLAPGSACVAAKSSLWPFRCAIWWLRVTEGGSECLRVTQGEAGCLRVISGDSGWYTLAYGD